MKALITEYLINTNQLTGTMDDADFQDNGKGDIVLKWNFPEPQPDFAAIEASQGFQNYRAGSDIIKKRIAAKKQLNDILWKAIEKVFLNQLNVLRAKAGLGVIPPQQFRQAIEQEIDLNT